MDGGVRFEGHKHRVVGKFVLEELLLGRRDPSEF